MVMGLRRFVLGTRALPFCTSTSPLQLHAPFLEARHTLNSLWTSSFTRFFSANHTNSNLSESISETQEQDEAAKRAKRAARSRTDNGMRDYKLATDLEYLRNYRLRQRIRNNTVRKRQDRTHENQVARERERMQDPAYALYQAVRIWIRRHQWVRDSLPWKSHLPILYPEKVKHECSKCFLTRFGGAKLWWRKKTLPGQNDQSYECHRCHLTGFEKLPEGYENIKEISYTALKARKIELDGPDSVPEPKLRPRKTMIAKP